jgi:predicted  nucleic acid-binding Zn-ribbon protein
MAESFDTLMQVQEHDIVLDQLRHRIETLPERSGLRSVRDRHAVVAAASKEVQAQVDDLSGRQRLLEEKIASTARRRHEIEQRMESGQVSSSRDLQAMDHEVHQLGDRMSHLEEEEILLLEEQEPLDAVLAEHLANAAVLAEEAAGLETALATATEEIEAAIVIAAHEREVLAAGLPADLADRYEFLRARLGGVGAARLVGDHCDGCHLTLSSVEVERIRRLPPDEFNSCPECDRILVH